MNAREARERSLWNSLDSNIRERIIVNVNGGYTSAFYYYKIDTKNKDILTDLGYSVTFEDGTTIIEW